MNAPGELTHELHTPIGVATITVAEYRGLVAALSYLAEHGYDEALSRSDSQLLARQTQGHYRVPHPSLLPLYRQATPLEAQLGQRQLLRRSRPRQTVLLAKPSAALLASAC